MLLIENFSQIERYFLIYIISINITAFFIYALDKFKAKKKSWRIPEIQLISIGLIGGAVGSIIGMVVFKHKLSKKRFSIGIPLIILINFITFIYIAIQIK